MDFLSTTKRLAVQFSIACAAVMPLTAMAQEETPEKLFEKTLDCIVAPGTEAIQAFQCIKDIAEHVELVQNRKSRDAFLFASLQKRGITPENYVAVMHEQARRAGQKSFELARQSRGADVLTQTRRISEIVEFLTPPSQRTLGYFRDSTVLPGYSFAEYRSLEHRGNLEIVEDTIKKYAGPVNYPVTGNEYRRIMDELVQAWSHHLVYAGLDEADPVQENQKKALDNAIWDTKTRIRRAAAGQYLEQAIKAPQGPGEARESINQFEIILSDLGYERYGSNKTFDEGLAAYNLTALQFKNLNRDLDIAYIEILKKELHKPENKGERALGIFDEYSGIARFMDDQDLPEKDWLLFAGFTPESLMAFKEENAKIVIFGKWQDVKNIYAKILPRQSVDEKKEKLEAMSVLMSAIGAVVKNNFSKEKRNAALSPIGHTLESFWELEKKFYTEASARRTNLNIPGLQP